MSTPQYLIDPVMFPPIITATVTIAIAAVVYWRGRKQARIAAALELHKEFYSKEFAKVRNEADRFVMFNYRKDWSQKPTDFDDPESTRDSMHQLIRFFYRASVLESVNQVDRRLLYALFAQEIGYWAGYLFLRMEKRPDWSTKGEVLRLVQRAEYSEQRNKFLAGYQAGKDRAENGKVLLRTSNGELMVFARDVADVFGSG